MVGPLSDRLSPSDLDILAGARAPTLGIPSCSSSKSSRYGPNGNILPNSESRFSTRRRRMTASAAQRVSERPPLVPRRLRRLVNDRALHAAAVEMDALPTNRADLRALFERRVDTAFSQICHDSEAALAWSPFIELDEDEQRLLLANCSHHSTRIVQHETEGGINRVDRKIRHLLKIRGDGIKSLVGQVEDSVVDLAVGETVVLRLPHALSRMIAHGVAQFHRLGHRSLGVGADRVLVIRGQGHTMQGCGRLVDALA